MLEALFGVIIIGVLLGLFVGYIIMPIMKKLMGDAHTFSILPICYVLAALILLGVAFK